MSKSNRNTQNRDSNMTIGEYKVIKTLGEGGYGE